jgi:hypothetical protein
MFYIIFKTSKRLQIKNSKLGICRSHQELQVSYTKYLYRTPYKTRFNFLIRLAMICRFLFSFRYCSNNCKLRSFSGSSRGLCLLIRPKRRGFDLLCQTRRCRRIFDLTCLFAAAAKASSPPALSMAALRQPGKERVPATYRSTSWSGGRGTSLARKSSTIRLTTLS